MVYLLYVFTVNNGNIYIIALGKPENGSYVVKSFGRKTSEGQVNFLGRFDKVSLLGTVEGASEKEVTYKITDEGLVIDCAKASEYPLVFKLEVY